MSIVKVFVCAKFLGDVNCHYAVSAANDSYVVDESAKHLYTEHQMEDTPELREQIIDSLIPVEVPI